MPLFFQPEPHGVAESYAHDALGAAGFGYTCRYLHFGPIVVRYYWAEQGAYRTRRHRSLRAVWAQVSQEGQLSVPPRKRPAPAVDATGQQVGDQSVSAAGGDIHQGIPPETAFDLVRFLWEDRQDRDIRREQLDHTLQDMRDSIELYRITLAQRITAVSVAVDAHAATQSRELRRLRRWLSGLTLVVVAVVAVAAWLAWRELGLLAARAAYDVALTVWRR